MILFKSQQRQSYLANAGGLCQFEIRMLQKENQFKVLIDAAALQRRVSGLADEINHHFKDRPLVVVGVLKGAFIFLSDLFRQMNMPVTCDFLGIRSYDAQGKRGSLQLEFDLSQDIQGKEILLVEDIVDSGNTLKYLLAHLEAKRPAAIHTCTLLHKSKKSGITVDYEGFSIEDDFVLGYGMDLDGLYRNLPDICVFSKD